MIGSIIKLLDRVITNQENSCANGNEYHKDEYLQKESVLYMSELEIHNGVLNKL